MEKNYHHQATIQRRNRSSSRTHYAMWKSSCSSTSCSSTLSSARKLHHVSVRRQRRRQPLFVMKRNMDMKQIEKLYDCFILDFNPDQHRSTHVRNKSHSSRHRGDPDICRTTHVRNKFHSSSHRGDSDIRRTIHVRNKLHSSSYSSGTDIRITAEKGKVALRDYPHPRHLCTRYPFSKTPPHKHCRRE